MHQSGEAVHLLGDLITFTIKRADVRTANLAIERLGDRLEALVREDLVARPMWGEVFADEVAYHASHIARACLEADDGENLLALVGLVEHVTVALLETGHGPAAHPLVGHLVHLGRELIRRGDGEGAAGVVDAVARAGRTMGSGEGEHLFESAASALGALGAAAAGVRFERSLLAGGDAAVADPARASLAGLEDVARAALGAGLEPSVAASIEAVSTIGRAVADADAPAVEASLVAGTLRRVAEVAAAARAPAPVVAVMEALAEFAEAGRRLDRPALVEAALGALAALGSAFEGLDLPVAQGEGHAAGATGAAALAARHLRAAGEGYEYLLARALRAAGDGPFRRRFQGTGAPTGGPR